MDLDANQLEEIRQYKRLRQRLRDANLIDEHGKIIVNNLNRTRSKRRHRSKKQTVEIRPTSFRAITSNYVRPLETASDGFQRRRHKSAERKPTTDLSTQKKQINNPPSLSARSPSSNELTWIENVVLRRLVSPEKSPCKITIRYIGDLIDIPYDRDLFIPSDDEIVIKQQHCGGENRTVFKGLLKHKEHFVFDSQRHKDYPFALTLYINGVVYNRVSICCEYRSKAEDVSILGPNGRFNIEDVDSAKPCRRCRFKSHMKDIKKKESEHAHESKANQSADNHSTNGPGPTTSSTDSNDQKQPASRQHEKQSSEIPPSSHLSNTDKPTEYDETFEDEPETTQNSENALGSTQNHEDVPEDIHSSRSSLSRDD